MGGRQFRVFGFFFAEDETIDRTPPDPPEDEPGISGWSQEAHDFARVLEGLQMIREAANKAVPHREPFIIYRCFGRWKGEYVGGDVLAFVNERMALALGETGKRQLNEDLKCIRNALGIPKDRKAGWYWTEDA